MLNKKEFFKDSDFSRLAGAKKNKDYDTIVEICDKFLSMENLDEIEGVRSAFERIKAGAIIKNEQDVTDGFFDLVKCDGDTKDVKSAKEFIADCTLALKMGNDRKAKERSKEYADITAAAMRTSGKPKLSDTFLMELARASLNRDNKKMQKLLKKIQ